MRSFYFVYVVIILSCSSCEFDSRNSKEETGFDYKDYGNVKEISINASNTLDLPLILRFNSTNDLEEIGHYDEGTPTGLISYYVNTALRQLRQYIIVDSAKYVNQYWSFDNMGNIIRDESNYFSISISSDTVMVNEPCLITAILDCSVFDSEMNLIIGNFDENFVLKDTCDLLLIPGMNNIAKHELYFETPGEKVIRGCIDDYKIVEGMAHSRYMYFDKIIFVSNE